MQEIIIKVNKDRIANIARAKGSPMEPAQAEAFMTLYQDEMENFLLDQLQKFVAGIAVFGTWLLSCLFRQIFLETLVLLLISNACLSTHTARQGVGL